MKFAHWITSTTTAADWFVAAAVVVALFVGVGNWVRDASVRAKGKRETTSAFAILIAHDMEIVSRQGVEARRLLEQSRFGPSEGDDGQPINVFHNVFSSGAHPQFSIDRPPALDHSAVWAQYLPAEVIKCICSTSRAIRAWSDRVAALENGSEGPTLSPEIGDVLVFHLDQIQLQSSKVRRQLEKLTKLGNDAKTGS